ncbi:MAG: urease subunit beta [Dehalococcoidia bacterium]
MSEPLPGATIFGAEDLILNAGREAIELAVTNTGDRAIQVGSHFHFFEANAALQFDRRASFGRRLNIPSGTAVRFEAGQTHTVSLISFGGREVIIGFNGLTVGNDVDASMAKAAEKGFVPTPEPGS